MRFVLFAFFLFNMSLSVYILDLLTDGGYLIFVFGFKSNFIKLLWSVFKKNWTLVAFFFSRRTGKGNENEVWLCKM